MTDIFAMTSGHELWEDTILFSENCSWKAGPFLAERMRRGDFADWERVFVACVDGKIAGFCTLSEKDELPAHYDFSPFVGFVFVGENYRGHRLSGQMLEIAADYARSLGYGKVYVMSGEVGLYEKYGFEKLGEYKTIYDTTDQLFVKSI